MVSIELNQLIAFHLFFEHLFYKGHCSDQLENINEYNSQRSLPLGVVFIYIFQLIRWEISEDIEDGIPLQEAEVRRGRETDNK